MSSQPAANRPQTVSAGFRGRMKGLLPSIVIGAVFPAVIYMLISPHMSTLGALAVSAIPAAIFTIYTWTRTRSPDLISLVSLFTMVVSMLVAALVHNPRLLLLKDSYLTGTFGLICLGSLLFGKPVGYFVYLWAFAVTPEQRTRMDAGWQIPYSRHARRLVTTVWGLAFVAETILDAILVYHLSITQFIAIHPFLFWGTLILTMGWATVYSGKVGAKLASLQQQANARAVKTGEE